MTTPHAFQVHSLPATGFVRLSQIIGDSRRGIPGVIPVGPTTWWSWVKSGKAPKSLKLGSMTAWRAEDIHALIERLASEAEAETLASRGPLLTETRRRKSAAKATLAASDTSEPRAA